MNILVTGAKGFIGRNLVAELRHQNLGEIMEFDVDTDTKLLDKYCMKADFVFHLAGVNRPKETTEFMEGNFGFTSDLLEALKRNKNFCTVMISSSTQAALDNPYGLSKKAGEDLMFAYSKETGAKVLVYRFPNVFGKWCKPNYNSAVATFCNNISRGLEITINDRNYMMTLVYIDDILDEMLRVLSSNESGIKTGDEKVLEVPVTYSKSLGEIADMIYTFKESRKALTVPDMSDAFSKKLYSTYLSYLPNDEFSYELKMNVDQRGSFTEFLKSPQVGQVSVNISKPGITKGNHWHHTKNEKFLVVSGNGVIRFRAVDSDEVIEYFVSGEKLEVVDIPVGLTHNIENLGHSDMVTIMWCNEIFNPEKPDTYFLEV